MVLIVHHNDVDERQTGGQAKNGEPNGAAHAVFTLVHNWHHEHEERRDRRERDQKEEEVVTWQNWAAGEGVENGWI